MINASISKQLFGLEAESNTRSSLKVTLQSSSGALGVSISTTVGIDEVVQSGISNALSKLSVMGGVLVSGSLENIKSGIDYSPAFETGCGDLLSSSNSAVQNKRFRLWEARAAKQAIVMSMLSHPSSPLTYEEDGNSMVIEFCYHPSHLVCVVDDSGVQFLWTKEAEPHSDYVSDDAISFGGLSQKLALLVG